VGESKVQRIKTFGVVLLFLLIFLMPFTSSISTLLRDKDDSPVLPLFKKTLVKEPPILWNTTIHEGWYNIGRYIEKRDDGFLIIGDLTHSPDTDIGIIKTDFEGNIEWKKIVELYDDNPIRRIIKTKDNGYLINGNIQQGIYDIVWGLGIYIVKIDSFGNEQWNMTYYYEDNISIDYFDRMISLSDDGFLIGGIGYLENGSVKAPFLMKVNENGEIIWQNYTFLNDISSISFMYETGDQYYLVGSGKHVYKINHQGEIIWEKTFDYPKSIIRIDERNTDEFDMIIGNKDNIRDIYLVTINGSGDIINDQVIAEERIVSVKKTSDEGYIILGDQYPICQYHLIKTDENGDKEWNISLKYNVKMFYSRKIILNENSNDGFFFLFNDNNLQSSYQYDMFYKIYEIDENGKEEWNKTIYPGYCDWYLPKFRITQAMQTDDFGYVLLGYKNIPNELDWEWDDCYDIYLMKLSGVVLEMRNIRGGRLVSMTIKNDGYGHYYDLNWSFGFEGSLYNWSNSTGSIDILKDGDESVITSELVFGFGWGNVTTTVEDLVYKQPVFYLGPFIIIDRGIFRNLNIIRIIRN